MDVEFVVQHSARTTALGIAAAWYFDEDGTHVLEQKLVADYH